LAKAQCGLGPGAGGTSEVKRDEVAAQSADPDITSVDAWAGQSEGAPPLSALSIGEDDMAVVEQGGTLLDEIGGPEVTRCAAQHVISAMLADDDPDLSVRPLFARVLAEPGVDAHVGHLARSFQQLFGGGRSGRPLTEELLRSWHPASAGQCTRRQLDAVYAHVMEGFTIACPEEEAVGRVMAYFGTFSEVIQSVFLAPDELRLAKAEPRPPAPRPPSQDRPPPVRDD
jgi:hypothetical protein